jgi:hypothetical protein
MPEHSPVIMIRDKKRNKKNYHGYGPDGYKPGPFHGLKTNLDYVKEHEQMMNR